MSAAWGYPNSNQPEWLAKTSRNMLLRGPNELHMNQLNFPSKQIAFQKKKNLKLPTELKKDHFALLWNLPTGVSRKNYSHHHLKKI